MPDMQCSEWITKDMDVPKVPVVTSESLRTLLTTAMTSSSLLPVGIRFPNSLYFSPVLNNSPLLQNSVILVFQSSKITKERAGSCMESQWEGQWPCYCIKRTLRSGTVPFSLLPCVRCVSLFLLHIYSFEFGLC